ncbi:hypothetical protein ADUPG1_013347, partial [Aduncisulcus paluster]
KPPIVSSKNYIKVDASECADQSCGSTSSTRDEGKKAQFVKTVLVNSKNNNSVQEQSRSSSSHRSHVSSSSHPSNPRQGMFPPHFQVEGMGANCISSISSSSSHDASVTLRCVINSLGKEIEDEKKSGSPHARLTRCSGETNKETTALTLEIEDEIPPLQAMHDVASPSLTLTPSMSMGGLTSIRGLDEEKRESLRTLSKESTGKKSALSTTKSKKKLKRKGKQQISEKRHSQDQSLSSRVFPHSLSMKPEVTVDDSGGSEVCVFFDQRRVKTTLL